MENKKDIKNKRLKFSMFAFCVNALIFIYGLHKEVDLSSLGVGLSMLNAPLVAFVTGDTIRASKKED